MVNRRLPDCGSVARQCARPWRRPDAMWAGYWILSSLIHLAVRERLWTACLAHHVLHRGPPGAVCALVAHRRSRVAKVGAQQRKAKIRQSAKKERRCNE